MAQLTMQRHNSYATEGTFSASQAPESYKALKNEPADHFQKNISASTEKQIDTKKISDRGLKRRDITNDSTLDQSTPKKLKSVDVKNLVQFLESSQEPSLSLSLNDVMQDVQPFDLQLEEMHDLRTEASAELEKEISLFPFQEADFAIHESPTKQQFQDDLLSIAALDKQKIKPSQDLEEPTMQLFQPDQALELSNDEIDSKTEIEPVSITSSLLSAAHIENTKPTESQLRHEHEPPEMKTEPIMLFSVENHSNDPDLIEISALTIDDAQPIKEMTKRKKSKEVDDSTPKQLSFAFVEQPIQKHSLAHESFSTAEKSEALIETNPLDTKQEELTQPEVVKSEKTDQTASLKVTSIASETAVPPSSPDKTTQPFGIVSSAPLSTVSSLTDTNSTAPSIMPTPNQTAPEQVSVRLITALNNGDDQIHIRLTPEDLGEITIKLNISDQRVNALIQSDNADTLKLLQKESHMLENALKESGFTLESHNMEFSFSGGESRQDQAALQNEIIQLKSSNEDDMFTSITDLSTNHTQAHDYILTPTKVDIHI